MVKRKSTRRKKGPAPGRAARPVLISVTAAEALLRDLEDVGGRPQDGTVAEAAAKKAVVFTCSNPRCLIGISVAGIHVGFLGGEATGFADTGKK